MRCIGSLYDSSGVAVILLLPSWPEYPFHFIHTCDQGIRVQVTCRPQPARRPEKRRRPIAAGDRAPHDQPPRPGPHDLLAHHIMLRCLFARHRIGSAAFPSKVAFPTG
jgi:hypothetical protein